MKRMLLMLAGASVVVGLFILPPTRTLLLIIGGAYLAITWAFGLYAAYGEVRYDDERTAAKIGGYLLIALLFPLIVPTILAYYGTIGSDR